MVEKSKIMAMAVGNCFCRSTDRKRFSVSCEVDRERLKWFSVSERVNTRKRFSVSCEVGRERRKRFSVSVLVQTGNGFQFPARSTENGGNGFQFPKGLIP